MKAFTDELVKICRHFGVFEREIVCCGTVTVPQCLVLQQLRHGACDVGSLAAYTGSSTSAMTRLIDGLGEKGWVERRRDDADRRRVLVSLTASGCGEATRLYEQTDAIVGQLFERIPTDSRGQVVHSMRQLRLAMDSMSDAIRACCGQ